MWTLQTAQIKQKNTATLTVVGLNDNRAIYIASSKFSEPKRFGPRLNKVDGKYIQEQLVKQFHCYNKNKGFFKRMDQSVSKYKIGIRMKKWWWSPFAYMFDVSILDVVLQNAQVLYHISKDEVNEFFCLSQLAIFLKYSMEDRSASNHEGIQNVPSDVCYEVAHYQVPSKKQGMCKVCENNFRCRSVKCKTNLHDICFEIFHGQ